MSLQGSNAVAVHRDQNSLLAALNDSDWRLLAPHLEARELARDEAIFLQGEQVAGSTFPCGRMVVSLRIDQADGMSCEVGAIGREGAVGGIVSHGRVPAFTSAVVETGGAALCVASAKLESLKSASPAVNRLFARYADCLLAQIMQGAACNALHDVEQRIARWLLSFQDRYGGDVIPITQEDLAATLGIGRPYASRQLKTLKNKGLIELRRGSIRICDRAQVERASCDCYRAVKSHFETVLTGLYPDPHDEMSDVRAAH